MLTNAAAYGGGIYNFGPLFATPAYATLDNSRVRGNIVISDGGGIYNDAIANSAGLALQNNSFVSFNTAAGGSGAGIYNNSRLTVTNSMVSFNASGGTSPQAGGGGLYNGPGGDMALADASVFSNSAAVYGGGLDNIGTATGTGLLVQGNVVSGSYGLGGGLYNEGHLSLDASTITGNAFGPSGGDGAGLLCAGWVTITNGLISNNSAGVGFGGGVSSFANGMLRIEDSTIRDNTGADGGGIYNQQAQILVVDSTFSGNHATGVGGAISSYGTNTSLIMTNTTVSGNQAGGAGGGIWSRASVYLNNVTVAFNVAPNGGGLSVPITSTPVLTALNTIVADNLSSGLALNCYGSVASLGYNLIGNDQGCDFHPNGGTDLVGTPNHPIDALLNGLALNGNFNGPWTDALFVGSPAIDAGSPFASPNATACASTDERGVARPVPDCDIGAFQGSVAVFRLFLPLIGR